MPSKSPACFAKHGGEKMLYDVRMGPVAVLHAQRLYVAYHASMEDGPTHPCIIVHDIAAGEWSAPEQVAESRRYDHHYAPVIWFDADGRLHCLHNCHGGPGVHQIARDPVRLDRWESAPAVADSISYPHIVPLGGNRFALYYRTFGHMGWWGYRLSADGGMNWGPAVQVVDMDQTPDIDHDTWAGSYHSIASSPDRSALHVAFVYLDERRRMNPLYGRDFKEKRTLNRYHLYYLRIHLQSGRAWNIGGEELPLPLNRAGAEACKVWDTGHRLTNMPSIWVDEGDRPHFLLPVQAERLWEGAFYYVHHRDGAWRQTPVAPTNSTWSGCLLRGDGNRLRAWVSSGKDQGETLAYAGGDLEEWRSQDAGETWSHRRTLSPVDGWLYNNPRLAERADGSVVEDMLLFFGWEGPGSLCQRPASGQARNRGHAFHLTVGDDL